MSSLFSSDTLSSWEKIEIPNPTSQPTPGSIKVEENFITLSESFSSPSRHWNGMELGPTDIGQEMPSNSQQSMESKNTELLLDYSNIGFENFLEYNVGSNSTFISFNGLFHQTKSLDLDLCSLNSIPEPSPATDSLISSQTTLNGPFNMQPPKLSMNSIRFDLHHGSPGFDYAPEFSIGASLKPPKSLCLRQPIFCEVHPSALSLHHIHSQVLPIREDSNTSLLSRGGKACDGSKECFQDVEHVKGAMFRCSYEACTKRFQRKEHLRRHEKTCHSENRIQCPFCHKPFNRQDNLIQHVKIHSKPKSKYQRTQYFEGAASYLCTLKSKTKMRRPRTGKTESNFDAF